MCVKWSSEKMRMKKKLWKKYYQLGKEKNTWREWARESISNPQ